MGKISFAMNVNVKVAMAYVPVNAMHHCTFLFFIFTKISHVAVFKVGSLILMFCFMMLAV